MTKTLKDKAIQAMDDCIRENGAYTPAELVVDAAIAVALEEAAKVADGAMERYANLAYSPNHSRIENAAKTYCSNEIATAIRNLKDK